MPSYAHISHLTRYLIIGVGRATQHDVLETYKPFIKNAKLFLNAGVTPEEGAALIDAGKIDGVCIGMNWISHADLAKRVQHGKALENQPNFAFMQMGQPGGDWAVGYTDYPTATY